jgi:hypothetical protein
MGMSKALFELKGTVVMEIPWCNMTFLNATVKKVVCVWFYYLPLCFQNFYRLVYMTFNNIHFPEELLDITLMKA